ncbi:uncharacterized protein LOC132198740 isoform X2 [Neocloeon triangulifer]|uniref:uncharacterized protein LOC132198740 isoform X2 n=1 Tax=Neocloeon triangulifer TaxID=2078957 RepID=UPI00286F8268|nr:uncharacterized protein LOC132198740 isoform X2 [Neocloeon triangulifer]
MEEQADSGAPTLSTPCQRTMMDKDKATDKFPDLPGTPPALHNGTSMLDYLLQTPPAAEDPSDNIEMKLFAEYVKNIDELQRLHLQKVIKDKDKQNSDMTQADLSIKMLEPSAPTLEEVEEDFKDEETIPKSFVPDLGVGPSFSAPSCSHQNPRVAAEDKQQKDVLKATEKIAPDKTEPNGDDSVTNLRCFLGKEEILKLELQQKGVTIKIGKVTIAVANSTDSQNEKKTEYEAEETPKHTNQVDIEKIGRGRAANPSEAIEQNKNNEAQKDARGVAPDRVERVICYICYKPMTRRNFGKHMRNMHDMTGPYHICLLHSVCFKTFADLDQLKEHMKDDQYDHTTSASYNPSALTHCSLCGMRPQMADAALHTLSRH